MDNKLHSRPLLRLLRLSFYGLYCLLLILLILPICMLDISLWWLDNLVNLQLQWSLLAGACALINVTYIKRGRIILSLLCAMAVAYNLLPLYLPPSLKALTAKAPLTEIPPTMSLTIAQLNLNYNNPHLKQLLPILGSQDYDLLILQEASDKEHESISELAGYYRYTLGMSAAETTPSGLAIFSRWPFTEAHIHDLGFKSGHILEVVIEVPYATSPIQLFSLHPGAPRTEKLWQQRNQVLVATAEKAMHSPFINQIIVGDFNTSPWSGAFKRLQRETQLNNSANGFGYHPSWSYGNQFLLSLLSSAYIDHQLVSRSFNVLAKHSRDVPGSDHLLVVTTLSMNAEHARLQKDLQSANE